MGYYYMIEIAERVVIVVTLLRPLTWRYRIAASLVSNPRPPSPGTENEVILMNISTLHGQMHSAIIAAKHNGSFDLVGC